MTQTTPLASSECPVCGIDTPHVHTKRTLAADYREEQLHKRFVDMVEKFWYRQLSQISAGFHYNSYMTERAPKYAIEKYRWWPVEMLWMAFRNGADFTAHPLPDDAIPSLEEALEIKKNPWGVK